MGTVGWQRVKMKKKKKKKMEREIQEGDGGAGEERRTIFSCGVFFLSSVRVEIT